MHTEETKIYTVILLAVVVIGVIISYYIYSIIRAHKHEVQRKTNYMFNEMTILEKERERIAQNIHDSAGPELSILKFELDALEDLSQANTERVVKIKAHVDTILSDLRYTTHNLMPTALMNYGLVSAISELCSNTSRANLKILFTPTVTRTIDQGISIHLYRIVEEIIFNTIKHAEATKLLIVIKEENNNFMIITKDDGKGFNMAKIDQSNLGLGLKGFEYRTELLGGTYSLFSEEGKGVEVVITIPFIHS